MWIGIIELFIAFVFITIAFGAVAVPRWGTTSGTRVGLDSVLYLAISVVVMVQAYRELRPYL
jgi:hypothetical protein